MNPMSRLTLICLAALSAASCNNSEVYTVKVSGEGLDFYRDSSRVLVYEDERSDIRFDRPVAYGYLDKGRFSLSFQDSMPGKVYVMFAEGDIEDDGTFYNRWFFSDRTPVHFTVSRNRFGNEVTEVTGSSDNEELYLYQNRNSEIHEATDSMFYELDRWRISKYGEDGCPEEDSEDYLLLSERLDSINAIRNRVEAEYNKEFYELLRNRKSLAGLFKITKRLDGNISGIMFSGRSDLDSALLELYKEYREVYPDNRMVQLTDSKLSALEGIRPGMPYRDFEAPSTDGKRYSLSELAGGRIAVLDCWASWCPECRKHSIELIPLYEKYKDKGFTVIGVAKEYKNLEAMEKAVEKDGYPWIQLYDLDDAEGIWKLYNLDNAGGGIFLIGKDGRIVEKVSDISSIRSYLEEHLDK